ncbi:MAG: hypothetical protein JW726_05225 [Anaerolineales bacterium]|nr:hypothetical protein [Anaerolineales bacterium]
MNLIDTYIGEIGRRLPQKTRHDIESEIRSLLEDMLQDRSQQAGRPVDDEMILEVLQEYGAPEKVAAGYLPAQYLIGPQLFPVFKTVLGIVLPIVAVLALVGLGVDLVRPGQALLDVVDVIADIIASLGSSLIQAFGNIVLIFAILQWVMPTLHEKSKAWDPRSLHKISPPDRVGFVGPILEIVFNLAVIVVLNFYPDLIGVGYSSTTGWTSYRILSDAFFAYVPAITLACVLEIILNILLLRQGTWQTSTRWFSLVTHGVSMVIAIAMLNGPSLIALTAESLDRYMPVGLKTAQLLVTQLNFSVRLGLVIAIVVNIVEIAKTIYRLISGKVPPVLIDK